jgi:transposase
MYFIRDLRHWIEKHGSHNIVYFDESGFAAHSYRPDGWAKRGTKVHGKIAGNHRKGRTNLIMAQRGKDWLAPMVFEGGCNQHTVLAWIEQALLPELEPNSLIIMDNAPFHNKPKIKHILQENGHTLMPLPTYSPDLNPIEKSFAILKRRRQITQKTIKQLLC